MLAGTTSERAEQIGLQSYDLAMPIDWARAVNEKTGMNPASNIVWCYDGPGLFGYPVAVSEEGRRILGRLAIEAAGAGRAT